MGLKTRYILFSNFCFELCFMLLDKNKNNPKVKEYRPIFVNTWLIMLQNYIDLRVYDLKELKIKKKELEAKIERKKK